MLWPSVLPAQITLALLAACVGAATVLAPRAKLKRLRVFRASGLLSLVAFIPSCCLVMRVIDARRFGVFEYAAFDQVADWRVERYLPPTATGITLEKKPMGFRARFRIDETGLRSYVDACWQDFGDRSVVKPENISEVTGSEVLRLRDLFGDLGWPPLSDAKYYSGPRGRNGSGFEVWYSPSQKIAYERAGYW